MICTIYFPAFQYSQMRFVSQPWAVNDQSMEHEFCVNDISETVVKVVIGKMKAFVGWSAC